MMVPSDGSGEPVNLWIGIGVILASTALSAFFAGSETALTAASRARMHAMEKAGDANAARVNRLLTIRPRFISAMLLGNTIVNIGAAAYTTSLLVALVGDNGVIYATILMSILVLVFAEVLPKTLAITYPDRFSLLASLPASIFVGVFAPVLATVEAVVHGVLGLFGITPASGEAMMPGHTELKSAVDLMHKEGGVGRSDRDMVGGLLDLRDLEVSDVMVHRTKMRSINASLPPPELVREVLSSPYTRMPLWRGQPENIVGVLHAKDLLRALDAAGGDPEKLDIDGIALEPWFVPDSITVQDQLQAFLKRKTHFALVVDEYGEVMGLVTLEDILEEIVGDIKDEHDVNVAGMRILADGSVKVEGSVPIRDLNRVMDWHLPDEEATTIAGLVIHEARAIPETGQVFTFYNFRFEVLRKARNRIAALRISPASGKPSEGESAGK